MGIFKNLLNGLISCFYPARCPFCSSIIQPQSYLCSDCLEKYFLATGKVRVLDLHLPDSDQTASLSCLYSFLYAGNVKKAILNYKFRGQKNFGKSFGFCTAKSFKLHHSSKNYDFVTSIPLLKKQKRNRGFNQSEVAADHFARAIGLPYLEVLEKIKQNKTQHDLPKEERKQNVRGVYDVLNAEDVKGKSIILVDDIVTTGSTLKEACKVLLKNGAASVLCAAIANVDYTQL